MSTCSSPSWFAHGPRFSRRESQRMVGTGKWYEALMDNGRSKQLRASGTLFLSFFHPGILMACFNPHFRCIRSPSSDQHREFVILLCFSAGCSRYMKTSPYSLLHFPPVPLKLILSYHVVSLGALSHPYACFLLDTFSTRTIILHCSSHSCQHATSTRSDSQSITIISSIRKTIQAKDQSIRAKIHHRKVQILRASKHH